MAFTVVFLACLIVAPLLAHVRHWKPASLFAVVVLVYVVFGGIRFVNTQVFLSSLQKSPA